MTYLNILIDIIGWIYFFAWSLSFYGQVYLNWKLKSVVGYNLNFQVLNHTGFLCYSIYSTMGYFYNAPGTGTVEIQDLAFAYHALFMNTVVAIQCIIYPAGMNKVLPSTNMLQLFIWSFGFIYFLIVEVFNWLNPSPILSFWSILGYSKLLISFIKYTPQVWWNYKLKSTKGWSIFNVLCDFTGGTFSLLQIILKYIQGGVVNDFSSGLNITKFVLGIISIFFDIVFMIQHYILYPQRWKKESDFRLLA